MKANPTANKQAKEHSVDLLVGISPFEEGIDCLCEGCGHRQRVLGSHGERTGSSGAAWRWNKHTQRRQHTWFPFSLNVRNRQAFRHTVIPKSRLRST